MMSESIEDVLLQVMESRLADVHTSMPGTVVAFHGDTTPPTADVRPTLRRAVLDLMGATQYETLPVIPSVPVDYPFSVGSGVSIVWPLVPGDTVQLHFPERDTTEWNQSGGVESPMDERMHGLSGARCYPCGGSTQQPIPGGFPANQLTITAPMVVLGDNASPQFVALANLVLDRLTKLQNAFDTHVHATAAAGPPSPPTAVPGVIPVGTLASVAATKVKAT